MRYRAIATLTWSGLLLAAQGGCSREPASAPTEPRTIQARIHRVELSRIPRSYEAVGTVASRTRATISAKLSATVTAVHFEEGERVPQGRLLVELDQQSAAAHVRQSEAALEAARQSRGEVESSIQAAQAARQAAQAGAELAALTFNRYQTLLERKSVSQQEFDEAEARKRTADAELQAAQDRLKSLQAAAGRAQAQIEQSRAQLEQARISQGDTRVTAPFDGVVVDKLVEPGDLAAPGIPLLILEDGRRYEVDAAVDESQLEYIRQGGRVTVRLPALGLGLEGTVTNKTVSADPSSRSFVVKAALPRHEALRSGMYARVQFPTGEEKRLIVPASALVERGQLTGVYWADSQNVLSFRLVRVGESVGDSVEVLSGLQEGDRIVSEPGTQPLEGARVEEVPQKAGESEGQKEGA